MKIGKWVLGIAALSLLFGGTAMAQIDANQLCLSNGGEYYTNGPFHNHAAWPNQGAGKYYPSWTHQAALPWIPEVGPWPWKIGGWAWTGMQANISGPIWKWDTALQFSIDNPYASTMSFDYPTLFTGVYTPPPISNSGAPMPIYGNAVPTTIPLAYGPSGMIFPSSLGGQDAYLNIFAIGGASWVIPTTAPFYGWLFGFSIPCWTLQSVISLPSSNSVWQFVWEAKGPNDQYAILSANELDCAGGVGQKGRNYSLISDFDNGSLWYWSTVTNAVGVEWDMCLWVCDMMTIPYTIPGAPNAANPYAAYGFDVGINNTCPAQTTGCHNIGFMTQDFTGKTGDAGVTVLAAFGFPFPKAYIPVFKPLYRIPVFDILTTTFLGLHPLFLHFPQLDYPAPMWGDTIGAHSLAIPFPPDVGLVGIEFTFYGFALGKDELKIAFPPSAHFTQTLF
jgi:hypothetical protein